MSSFSLALVVLAAIIHASWNLLSKRAAEGGVAFVFIYNLVASVAYFPWVLWVFIHNVHNEVTWSLPAIICITLSAAIHLAYSLCLQRGYQVADLSVVYPIARGTGPMLSSIGAFLLLRETPSTHGVLGLIAVVAGIGLIATQGDLSAFRRPRGQQGVAWGAATGGLIASYTVVDGYAVKVIGVHPVVLDWFSNLVRFFMLVPLDHGAAHAGDGGDEGQMVARDRRRPALADVVHSGFDRCAARRAAVACRACTRDVDDGRRAVRHVSAARTRQRGADHRLPDPVHGRGPARKLMHSMLRPADLDRRGLPHQGHGDQRDGCGQAADTRPAPADCRRRARAR